LRSAMVQLWRGRHPKEPTTAPEVGVRMENRRMGSVSIERVLGGREGD
jgi:hypothetical protein